MTPQATLPPRSADPFAPTAPFRRRLVIALGIALVVVIGVGVAAYFMLQREPAPTFLTAPLTRGDLVETIETTGTLEPLLQVEVGAQVSGRVIEVLVDHNHVVKEGDLLARIDPLPFEAQVAQARASVMSAKAELRRAQADLRLQEANLARQKDLAEARLNARADLDAAQGARDTAAAQVDVAVARVAQAEGALTAAQQNLEYTRIFAPVDGTVITRAVDPGQTVAASFQAPVLFLIAQDLTTMRVIATIDEADVGKVQEGIKASVRVDAYPRESFEGVVGELRVAATNTNGVVTYPAVIDVPNAERKLRPGMTATVTLTTAERKGVLRVPNAALRFQPQRRASAAQAGARGPGAGAPQRPKPGQRALHVLRDGAPTRVLVEVGVNDGEQTEVISEELREGDLVILDDTAANPATGGSRRRAPRIF